MFAFDLYLLHHTACFHRTKYLLLIVCCDQLAQIFRSRVNCIRIAQVSNRRGEVGEHEHTSVFIFFQHVTMILVCPSAGGFAQTNSGRDTHPQPFAKHASTAHYGPNLQFIVLPSLYTPHRAWFVGPSPRFRAFTRVLGLVWMCIWKSNIPSFAWITLKWSII